MRVVIVGAGFGGVAAAIELRRHGFDDITILDAAPELGGTWFHNTYPGAACDIASHFYSFSYAQRKDWSRLCPLQPEILAYLREVAAQHGVDRLVRPNCEVTACDWDDTTRRWTVSIKGAEAVEADAVIVATGQLNTPSYPRLRGVEAFEGHSFHSARWDHDYDFRGKRVAVIGSGASAVQFLPWIADQAGHVTLFQRTANWFMPRRNRPYPRWVKAAVRRVPGLQAYRRRFFYEYCELVTVAIRNPRTVGRLIRLRSSLFMRWQLRGDPELRRKAWPDYTFGCKRLLFTSDFLPALRRPDVDLVTDAVSGLSADGVVTADGTAHPVDCLIYATGFKATDFMFPMEITGAGGRTLREDWAEGAHAHLGMAIPGYPSLFVMYGPNTNTSGGSIVFYLELQAAYIRQALALVEARGAGAIEVRADVEQAADRALQARFAGTAWTGCDSWYREDGGRIATNWPGYMRDYAAATRAIDPAEFILTDRSRPTCTTT